MRKPGLAILIALLSSAAAPGLAVRTAAIGTSVDWIYKRDPDLVRYRVGNVTLTVRAEAMESRRFVIGRPRVTVQMPGFAPVELVGDEASDHVSWNRLTVARWDAKHPYVLLQSWGDGANCCLRVQVVYPEGRRLRVLRLGSWGVDFLEKMPADRNGDGCLDSVVNESRFPYQFAANTAHSFMQPSIFNVVGGKAVDVSARPAFRFLFRKPMREQRGVCLGIEDRHRDRRKGACAAYAASAARLGQFDQAWAEIAKGYDRDATWPSLAAFNAYRRDVRQFLIRDGYIKG